MDFLVTACQVYGLWVGLGLLVMASIFYIFIENKDVPRKIFIGCILVFPGLPFLVFVFVGFINPAFFGFGYVTDNLEIAAHEKNILWATDYQIMSGSEVAGSYATHRLQSVNLDTGEILFHKPMGASFKPLGSKDGVVWAERQKEIVGLDVLTGELRIVVNEKSLMSSFPEFAKGVYTFVLNPENFLIDVVSQEGLHVSIDPVTNKKVVPSIEPIKEDFYEIKDYAVVENGMNIMVFNDDTAQKLVDGKKRVLNNDLTFLKGTFLHFDPITHTAILLSYETLDKKDFILRSVSADGTLLWEMHQTDVHVGDLFSPHPKLTTSFFYKDNVIFVFHGFVFSLNMSDGHLNWMTRI